MKEEIICAGSGGQGIVFMGRLLAWTAMKDKYFTTFIPSYGAEVRGGTANCSVVISDEEITSPLIQICTSAMVMNEASLHKFEPKVRASGLMVVNSSLTKIKAKRSNVETMYVPASEIAEEIGNVKVANMVIVGAFFARKKILSLDEAASCLSWLLPSREELIKINIQALEKGAEIVRGN